MAELGVGWIAIRPDVSKITPEIKKALGASEQEAGKSGDSMGFNKPLETPRHNTDPLC